MPAKLNNVRSLLTVLLLLPLATASRGQAATALAPAQAQALVNRALAAEGWYPPIHVLDSISRLMPAVTDQGHRERAALVRRLMAVYARS